MPDAAASLRPLRPEDTALLRNLFVDSRPELALLPLPPAQVAQLVEVQWQAQRAGHAASRPQAVDRVIEVAGESVGRVLVDQGPPVAVVDIALLPEHRGRGTGTEVLRRLLEDADARGVETELHVRRDNPAQRLYARLGFEVVAGADELDLRMVRPPAAPTLG